MLLTVQLKYFSTHSMSDVHSVLFSKRQQKVIGYKESFHGTETGNGDQGHFQLSLFVMHF